MLSYFRSAGTGAVVSGTFIYDWTQGSPFNGERGTVRYIPASVADPDP